MLSASDVITLSPNKPLTLPPNTGNSEGGQVAGFPAGVVFNQTKVTASVGDGGLKFATSGGDGAAGVYIPATPDKCNVGVLAGPEGFFFSDQFGGCDFTVMKTNDGLWAGSHVYSSDACRANIAAVPAGWTTVHTWRSAPYARRYGMTGSNCVMCFVAKGSLKFVMVRVAGYPPKVAEAVMSASVVI